MRTDYVITTNAAGRPVRSRPLTIPLTVAVFALVPAAADLSVALWLLSLVAAAVAAAVASYRSDLGSLAVVIMALPVSFYAPVGPRTNFSVADLVLVGVGIGTVLRRQNTSQRKYRLPAAISFYILAVGVTTTVPLLVASYGVRVDMMAGLLAVAKLLAATAYLAYFYGALRSRPPACRSLVFKVWADTSTVVATIAIVGAFLSASGIPNPYALHFRATGTFEDPNLLGAYLGVSIAIAMAHAHTTRSTAWTLKLLPLVAALLATGSRGALVAVVAALLLISVFGGSARALSKLRVALAGLSAVLVSIMVIGVAEWVQPAIDRSLSGLSLAELEDDSRARLWSAAISLFETSPIIGVGSGQFQLAASGLYNTSSSSLAHNTYLNALAETGVVGIITLLSVPVAVTVVLIRRAYRGDAMGAYLALALVSVFGSALTLNLQNFRVFWALVGISLVYASTRYLAGSRRVHTKTRRGTTSGSLGSTTQSRGGKTGDDLA